LSGPKIKLDRSRTHATVHGEGMTHAFEQDGLPFDHHGNLVMELVQPHQQALVEKKLKRLAKLSGEAPKDADSPPTPPEPDDQGGDDDGDDDADATSEMNFEAWLKDEQKYPQHEVFKEARKRYSKIFTNYRDLAEFLVFEENVVGPDQVPTKLGPRT
jgi:hypothetical protein